MRKEQIPLLGMDERPLQRQMSPGLAGEITNLRPDGTTDDMYWVPVDLAETYKNSSGDPLPASASRVKFYWHSRSRVGKYGDQAGSLMRLVSITDNGLVEVIDPDYGAGWETVASFQIVISESGEWDMNFEQMYDIGYITVTRGGKPQVDLILEDDLLLEFKFPVLPRIHTFTAPTETSFSDEEVQGGSTTGFNKLGSVYVRYAFRLPSGELVRHSLPEQILIPGREGNFNHQLIHHFQGFKTQPSNFDFWKDKISGVSILCSEFQANATENFIYEKNDQLDRLEETAWYEIGSFDFIDPSEVETVDLTFRNSVGQDTITGNLIADVDDNTHHIKRHGTCFTYNSRMILGGERTLFGGGVVNGKEASSNMFAYFIDGGFYTGSVVDQGDLTTQENFPKAICLKTDPNLMAGIASKLNEVNCDLLYVGGGVHVFVSHQSTWSVDFQFGNFGTLSINQDTFEEYKDGVLMHTPTGTNSIQVRMEVDLETDIGNYTRVHETTEQITLWRSPYVSRDASADFAWLPKGSVIGYPDLRAKEIRLFWFHTASGEWRLSNTFKLRPAKRANYAVHYTTWVDLYSNSATLIAPAQTPKEYLASKVAVSNVNDVLGYPSDQAYQVGSGNEEITGFAVNAIAISQGQYGQYPLYVFKQSSVWALEQSPDPDILFSRVSPIDTQFGVDDQSKITNVGETIFYVNRSGIQIMEGGRKDEVSQPIRSKVKDIVVLGSYVTENDRFLIAGMSSGDQYWFSVTFARWFRVTQGIKQYMNLQGDGYFIAPDGSLYDMQVRSANPVDVVVYLPALHWNLPDTLKRFHWIYGRAEISGEKTFTATLGSQPFTSQTALRLRPRWQSVFNTTLQLEASMSASNGDYLHRFEAELETRYTDRIKQAE